MAIQHEVPAGVIVTAAGPGMRRTMHDLAVPTFRRYAATWGWELSVHDLDADGSGADLGATRAKWAKIGLLRAALRSHPWALWLDADVLVLRDDDDIRRHLHPDAFQGMVIEQVPAEHRVNPNTGVWLLRACPRAFAFLDRVENLGVQPGPWADQGAVLAALGWDRGDESYHWARPGTGNAFTRGTSWLPPSWNQPFLEDRREHQQYNGTPASYIGRPAVPDPHALHFMGMLPEARHQHMAATLQRRNPLPTSA